MLGVQENDHVGVECWPDVVLCLALGCNGTGAKIQNATLQIPVTGTWAYFFWPSGAAPSSVTSTLPCFLARRHTPHGARLCRSPDVLRLVFGVPLYVRTYVRSTYVYVYVRMKRQSGMHAGSSPHFNNTDASSRTSLSTGGLRRVRRAAPVATHGLSGSSGVPDFPSLSVRRLSAACMERRGRTASWEHRIRSTEYGVRGSLFAVYLPSWHKVGQRGYTRFPRKTHGIFTNKLFLQQRGKKKNCTKCPAASSHGQAIYFRFRSQH